MPSQDQMFTKPFRVASKLEKRSAADIKAGRVGPSEVIKMVSWHEPDGTEITDADRLNQLESDHQAKVAAEQKAGTNVPLDSIPDDGNRRGDNDSG